MIAVITHDPGVYRPGCKCYECQAHEMGLEETAKQNILAESERFNRFSLEQGPDFMELDWEVILDHFQASPIFRLMTICLWRWLYSNFPFEIDAMPPELQGQTIICTSYDETHPEFLAAFEDALQKALCKGTLSELRFSLGDSGVLDLERFLGLGNLLPVALRQLLPRYIALMKIEQCQEPGTTGN